MDWGDCSSCARQGVEHFACISRCRSKVREGLAVAGVFIYPNHAHLLIHLRACNHQWLTASPQMRKRSTRSSTRQTMKPTKGILQWSCPHNVRYLPSSRTSTLTFSGGQRLQLSTQAVSRMLVREPK